MLKKIVNNGYIDGIGDALAAGEEITQEEYDAILTAVNSRPVPPDGYGYRLKEDLTWELYELPPEPDPGEEDIDPDELLTALEGIL